MMLRYTFDLDKEAEAVEEAVRKVLAEGYRTGDIMSEGCTLGWMQQDGRSACRENLIHDNRM